MASNSSVLRFLSTLVGMFLASVSSANAYFLKPQIIKCSAIEQKAVKLSEAVPIVQSLFFSPTKKIDSSLPFLVQVDQNTESTYFARVPQRDYDIYTSLPITDETTILRSLEQLNLSEMFARCPENSQLIEFAESTNFLVQICLRKTANDSTVFWMGYAKDGRGSLTLRIDENFEFWNIDTYYAIERRPLGENSYLLIGWPDGTLEAEALLYYYYPCFEDDC